MAHVLRKLHLLTQFARDDDRGASLVEYALLVALIALVCFVAVGFLGEETNAQFNEVGSSFSNP